MLMWFSRYYNLLFRNLIFWTKPWLFSSLKISLLGDDVLPRTLDCRWSLDYEGLLQYDEDLKILCFILPHHFSENLHTRSGQTLWVSKSCYRRRLTQSFSLWSRRFCGPSLQVFIYEWFLFDQVFKFCNNFTHFLIW